MKNDLYYKIMISVNRMKKEKEKNIYKKEKNYIYIKKKKLSKL